MYLFPVNSNLALFAKHIGKSSAKNKMHFILVFIYGIGA